MPARTHHLRAPASSEAKELAEVAGKIIDCLDSFLRRNGWGGGVEIADALAKLNEQLPTDET